MVVFSPLIEHAIELAAEWHDGTYRKGRWRDEGFAVPGDDFLRTPVMAHLTAVGLTVQRAGWDEQTVAAAFLHDVLEDRNRFRVRWTYEALAEVIGRPVADLVRYVTEPQRDASGQKLPWDVQKAAYVEQVRQSPVEAAAISVADKLHNLWNINQTLARGVDVFTTSGQRRGLSADPQRQFHFYQNVLAATGHHADLRLDALRQPLLQEVERFAVYVVEQESTS